VIGVRQQDSRILLLQSEYFTTIEVVLFVLLPVCTWPWLASKQQLVRTALLWQDQDERCFVTSCSVVEVIAGDDRTT